MKYRALMERGMRPGRVHYAPVIQIDRRRLFGQVSRTKRARRAIRRP